MTYMTLVLQWKISLFRLGEEDLMRNSKFYPTYRKKDSHQAKTFLYYFFQQVHNSKSPLLPHSVVKTLVLQCSEIVNRTQKAFIVDVTKPRNIWRVVLYAKSLSLCMSFLRIYFKHDFTWKIPFSIDIFHIKRE